MEGISHFRRRKCIVLNLNPTKTTKGDEDKTIRASVNGLSIKIEHGQEVDLLEPVYNALKTNARIDHYLTTSVDPETGEVTQKDAPKTVNQFSVTELGEWFWPEGHSPYDGNGVCIRHDLTKEELEKAPQNPQYLIQHPELVEKKSKEKVK